MSEMNWKLIVLVIVVSCILSSVSTIALFNLTPGLFTIKSEQIPDGLITSNKVSDEAIVTIKLSNGAVTSAKIKDGTILAEDLSNGSVKSFKIASGAVQTDKIADGSVTSSKLSDGSIVTSKLSDGSVTSEKIKDSGVSSLDIADGAIVTIKLADGSVNSAKILDGSISAIDLSDGSVITVKVADGAITTTKIADRAVTSAKLMDGSVTGIKLGSNAIPFEAINSTIEYATNSPIFGDMPAYETPSFRTMYLTITIERPSDIWIMFSASSYNTANSSIWVRAMINEYSSTPTLAGPSEVLLTSDNRWDSQSCNFIYRANSIGSYSIYIQWRVDGGIGHIGSRALAVLAIPS